MALLDPRLLEIEILSEAERKTFAGGPPYEHRRDGSVEREREAALMELLAARAIVYAKSYRTENMGDPEYALNKAASTGVAHLLTSATIIPFNITQRGRLRLDIHGAHDVASDDLVRVDLARSGPSPASKPTD